jgi:hypothetical protein
VPFPHVVGTGIRLHLHGKKRLLCPRGAMIHDPSGKHWPKCSLLIAPMGRGGRKAKPEEYEGAPKHYLGRTYQAKIVELEFPSASGDWETIGKIDRIDYVRGGTKAPGGFTHKMNAPRGVYKVTHFLKGGRADVTLRKSGSYYRLDFPRGCILDDRGIVYP